MKTTIYAPLYNAVKIKHLLRRSNQIPFQEQKYKKVAIFSLFPNRQLRWELYTQSITLNIPCICFTRTCTSMRVGLVEPGFTTGN